MTRAPLAVCAFAVLLGLVASSPRYLVLTPRPGGAWLTCARPANLGVWPRGSSYFAYFETRLAVGAQPARARVELRALRDASVRVDGQEALTPRADLSLWKEPRETDLAALLSPGQHTLTVVVRDEDGPPALWARSLDPEALPLRVADWNASCDGKTWAPAAPAGEVHDPDWLAEAPSPARGLLICLPWLLPLAAAAGALRWTRTVRPRAALLALLGYWAGLGALSLRLMPPEVGFDAAAHREYALFILQRHAIPLASQGWQAFQAPLYYLLAALGGADERWLRALNLMAGAGLAAASARFFSRALPDRPESATAGLAVAGLLPAALALCQLPGNEPLAALLIALSLEAALQVLQGERAEARLGALWGAALLAKTTAALLGPAVVLAASSKRLREAAWWKTALAATAVSGWYYAWVWARLGSPFLGGWDAARGLFWWQDPGARTLGGLLRFGASLRQPVYAGLRGFWDALYSTLWTDGWLSGMTHWRSRPPWHYEALEAGAWLALLPTALLAAGAWRAARGRLGEAGRLALSCCGVWLAAMLWMYLRLPAYSAVKASYATGLAPALGLLAAEGLEALPAGAPRRLAAAALAAWAAAAAFAYLPA